jgi:hypothetical protein
VLAITLPANIEITGKPKSDRGDPEQSGNRVVLRLNELVPGQSVELAIPSKLKESVAVDTRVVSQAELSFEGLNTPIYSNIAPILVVGQAPTVQPAVAATAAPTSQATSEPATPLPSATPDPNAQAQAVAAPAAPTTVAPTAVSGQPQVVKPAAPPLPETSSGVPISGMVLFGMTLLIRTVRIHRSQTRI